MYENKTESYKKKIVTTDFPEKLSFGKSKNTNENDSNDVDELINNNIQKNNNI